MFELIVGVIGAAIAVGQVFTTEKEDRQKQIFVATLVGSVVIATAGLSYSIEALFHYWRVSRNAEATLAGLTVPKSLSGEITRDCRVF